MLFGSKFKSLSKLYTTRLVLRPFVNADLERLYEICSNPTLGLSGGWKPHTSLEMTDEVLKNYFIAQPYKWAVTLKKSKNLVGSVGLSVDENHQSDLVKSLGYWLDEEYWGKGYISEAVAAVLDFSFRKLHLEVVTADCYPWNKASRKVLEKNGFVYEQTIAGAAKNYLGETQDLEYFYILHPLLRRYCNCNLKID